MADGGAGRRTAGGGRGAVEIRTPHKDVGKKRRNLNTWENCAISTGCEVVEGAAPPCRTAPEDQQPGAVEAEGFSQLAHDRRNDAPALEVVAEDWLISVPKPGV